MPFDLHKNFAYSTVSVAPSPAASGTSLTVANGDGVKFPTPPFNAVVWPIGVQPLLSNAEIIRVTNIVSDTFTILRGQEGSSNARTIVPGDQVAAGITDKVIKDIEDAILTKQDALTLGSILSGSGKVRLTGASGSIIGSGVIIDVKINLSELEDTSISSPTIDQILRYNGVAWVNGPLNASNSGSGIDFFPVNTVITGTGTNNVNAIDVLSKTPGIGATTSDSAVVNSSTAFIESYLYDTALGGTQLDAGIWTFDTYAMVNNTAAVSEVLTNIYRVRPGTGTVTTTGSGTSRTVNASSGTPFALVAIDTGGTLDSDSYLQTPQGLYRILTRVSDTQITIETPSTYANESTVVYNTWKRLFQSTTGDINSTSIALFTTLNAQPAFTIQSTDKLGAAYFAKTTRAANTTVTYVHGGSTQYTHFNSPLTTRHNDLSGLQGGSAGEYYHLTAAQATNAINAIPSTLLTTKGDLIVCNPSGSAVRFPASGANGLALVLDSTTIYGINYKAVGDVTTSGIQTLTNKTMDYNSNTFTNFPVGSTDGWTAVSDSWSYASADAPTFTITVPSGAASKYTPGDRIKLTQTTVKYFIITAVADTVLTVYGGTDYTLVDAAISAISFSHEKSPVGFPLSPAKWTVEVLVTSDSTQATPVITTWYNHTSINIPIGLWRVTANYNLAGRSSGGGSIKIGGTLSTANNSESDADMSSINIHTAGSGAPASGTRPFMEKILSLASKATYYLNYRNFTETTTVGIYGSVCKTILRAICAYL